MSDFYVEITDTFAGEANYCWVSRFKVKASSFRGAVSKLSRTNGGSFRMAYDCGDEARYNQRGACVCAFVMHWDDEKHSRFKFTSV